MSNHLVVAGHPATSGAVVLDSVANALRRYIWFDHACYADALALWAAHTWATPYFNYTPRLAITSPTKGAGKTLLFEVLEHLVIQPEPLDSNITAAGLRRVIAEYQVAPTFLIDEADGIFGQRRHEQLRTMINSGYKKGRTGAVAGSKGVVKYTSFAPTALAGIGDWMPNTVRDRSLVIHMGRPEPGTSLTPFDRQVALRDVDPIRDDLAGWVLSVAEQAASTSPALPDQISGRLADKWRPLVALADEAGYPWNTRARLCAMRMIEIDADDAVDADRGLALLADLRDIWPSDRPAVSTTELVAEHRKLIEPHLAETLHHRRLAELLRPFGVRSTDLRMPGMLTQVKAFRTLDLERLWRRYLPPVQ
jgi:hypothetical protein